MSPFLPCALARIDAAWPAGHPRDVTPRAEGTWPWDALAAVAVLAALLVAIVVWRDRRSHTPIERAFRALARRLHVHGRRRRLVMRLAARPGMPPVALLISEYAFDRALRHPGNAAAIQGGDIDPHLVADLRDRLFAPV